MASSSWAMLLAILRICSDMVTTLPWQCLSQPYTTGLKNRACKPFTCKGCYFWFSRRSADVSGRRCKLIDSSWSSNGAADVFLNEDPPRRHEGGQFLE